MSQMVPVKSEHIYIFVCYSASCPLILLHSGRRRGAFLGEVHPPLPLAPISPRLLKPVAGSTAGLSPQGCLGGWPGRPWRAAMLPHCSWHGFSRLLVRRGMFSVLLAMRAI